MSSNPIKLWLFGQVYCQNHGYISLVELVDIGEFQGFWSICRTDGELETGTQALDFTNTAGLVSPNTAGFDVNQPPRIRA